MKHETVFFFSGGLICDMALYPWKMHGGVIFAKVLHNESKVMIGLKHFQWSDKNFPSLISVWPIDSLISALSD